jgi:chaperone modulatory protein CbpM
MAMEDMIAASEFCIHHNVEYSFLNSLNECGLVEITTVEETRFIPWNELPKLERLIRLHDELDINVEGLEAIIYLLQRIESMQQEIMNLKNRLRLYEINV